MVLTYLGLGALSCAAIAATWHIMNRQYRGDPCIEWGPSGVGRTFAAEDYPEFGQWLMGVKGANTCGVCGFWGYGTLCSDCESWAEDVALLGVRRDNIAAFISALSYEERTKDFLPESKVWLGEHIAKHSPDNKAEHRRLVKKVGW